MASWWTSPGKGRRLCSFCGFYTASAMRTCTKCGRAKLIAKRTTKRRAPTEPRKDLNSEMIEVLAAGSPPVPVPTVQDANRLEPAVQRWAQDVVDARPQTSLASLESWLSLRIPYAQRQASLDAVRRWERLYRKRS